MTNRPVTNRHNGGPRLDDDRPPPPSHPADATCLRCCHWTPPSDRDEADYRAWQGGYGRRVKEPCGHCSKIQHRKGGPTAFGGVKARNSCYNFERKPDPCSPAAGAGFVTIWHDGRIEWQGNSGEEPAEFRQGELDL